ncbi:hypothetical protein C8K15_10689 [Paenisporosarcina sp. OV554]|nr:hypothetical protein C8K15_10689 [Paenisporosarcina sp. OV554]
MKVNINRSSFILSLFCIPLFFISISSENFISIFTKNIGIHPLNIVLAVTLISFLLGVIGLKDVRDWKSMARSVFTIVFTICASGILIFIIFFGSLLT